MRRIGLGVLAALLVSAMAWAAEPVAYITEMRRAGGDIRVRDADGSEWKAAQPLRPLRAGDQVRVSGDARVVLLYRAGGATQTVLAATSPFTVPGVVPPAPTEKLRVAAAGLTEFFAGKQTPPTFRKAATRGVPRAEGEVPAIVAPRQTRVFPGPLTFEWEGSERLTYGVRVLGPEGVVWAQERLSGRALPYPATAPALRAGVRYTWQLEVSGSMGHRTNFEIMSDAEVARVRARLDALPRTGDPGYSRTTAQVMRVGTLYEEGLYDAARREAEAAIATDPDEPTLYTLLGHIYQHIGLSARAAHAFERVRALAPES